MVYWDYIDLEFPFAVDMCVFKTHVKNLSPHVKQNNGHICCFHALMKFSHCIHPIPSQMSMPWLCEKSIEQHLQHGSSMLLVPTGFKDQNFHPEKFTWWHFIRIYIVYVCISLHIGGVFNLGADFLTIQNRMWKLPFNQKVWGWLRRATFKTPVGWWL